MLFTHRARGVEMPERELEAFSRHTLAHPATKLRAPRFVQLLPGYPILAMYQKLCQVCACNLQQHIYTLCHMYSSSCDGVTLRIYFVNVAAELYSSSCGGTFLRRYAVGHCVTEVYKKIKKCQL